MNQCIVVVERMHACLSQCIVVAERMHPCVNQWTTVLERMHVCVSQCIVVTERMHVCVNQCIVVVERMCASVNSDSGRHHILFEEAEYFFHDVFRPGVVAVEQQSQQVDGPREHAAWCVCVAVFLHGISFTTSVQAKIINGVNTGVKTVSCENTTVALCPGDGLSGTLNSLTYPSPRVQNCQSWATGPS